MTPQQAARVFLDTPGAMDELAKAITFCQGATSYQKIRIGMHYTIDPTGQELPPEIIELFNRTSDPAKNQL